MTCPINPICMPDKENTYLSVIDALLAYYGISGEGTPNKALLKALATNPKNVVLFVADGLSVDEMNVVLPQGAFLRQFFAQEIQSVFPSETVAANASLFSGQPVKMHGKTTFLSEHEEKYPPMEAPKVPLFEKIEKAGVDCLLFLPKKYWPVKMQKEGYGFKSLHQMMLGIQQKTAENDRRFILAYWPEPFKSGVMGVSRQEASLVPVLNCRLKRMAKRLKNTLLIVISNHGMVGVNDVVELDKIDNFADCLSQPLTQAGRVAHLFVKPEKTSCFEALYQQYLINDFLLLPRAQALCSGLLADEGVCGDYLLLAITDKIVCSSMRYLTEKPRVASGSITRRELIVPLIIYNSEG